VSHVTTRSARSAESRIVIVVGALLLAYGLTGLLFGGRGFAAAPVDGVADGERWLGIEANGWSNALVAAVGLVLLIGSPRQTPAKAAAVLGGLVLGAASAIALVDGTDVFGIFAANGPTMLAWGLSALVLLAVGLAPRPVRDARASNDDTNVDRRRFTRATEREMTAPRRR
jgi:hypothetical protein